MDPEEILDPVIQDPTTPDIVYPDYDINQILVDISEKTDLLTNRLDIILLLFIVFLTLYLFNLMRSKK